MTIKKLLLFMAVALLLPWPAQARTRGEVHTYIIQKGDTLWGISQRFIEDPHYWPNLWANNPAIGNPHLIYPGQKVSIRDGRLVIVPAPAKASPAPAAPKTAQPAPAPPKPKVQPSITIKTVGGSDGFVSRNDPGAVGTLIDTVDGRLLIGPGDKVFLGMKKGVVAKPGERFALFEVGHAVHEPATGEMIGHQMTDLGTVRVTSVSPSVTTAVVTQAYREITRGAKVRPYQAPVTRIALKKTDRKLSGYVVSAADNKMIIGQYAIIYVDLGTEQGLQIGNMLNITRPRKPTALALKSNIKLPEELVGSAVVIKARPHTATALILKVGNPVFVGDRVTTVTP